MLKDELITLLCMVRAFGSIAFKLQFPGRSLRARERLWPMMMVRLRSDVEVM